MVICFECSAETKRQLDALSATGGYADYGDAISSAVANQFVLTQRVTKTGAVVIDVGDGDGLESTAKAGEEARRIATVLRSPRPIHGSTGPAGVPALFALGEPNDEAIEFARPSGEGREAAAEVPASHWLWGQFNRFLPAKASCRALSNLQLETPAGVLLSAASAKIAESAAELGDFLTEYDRNMNLKRDDATATAFPHSGHGQWKAQQRFANQFVGSVGTDGVLTGMLFDLGLCNWDGPNESMKVRLTEAGWNLARLWNPILDERVSGPVARLTESEIRLLLGHIRGSVRREDFAYRFLMQAIEKGANRPAALDEEVAAANPQMSAAFVSTQRSGAIARMADLRLVARIRTGLNVEYAITDLGRQFLTK